MRIGIDAHILTPQHKRHNPYFAEFTEQLIQHVIAADTKQEHEWVLFFDSRLKDTKRFEGPNVKIQHFPFVQYRMYLPVLYSHMLISGYLTAARLDLFHSPEGLIPFTYPGKIITNFHYIPRGAAESNLFVRTFMLGAKVAFKQLCRRAQRIIVRTENDKKLLHDIHGYPLNHVVVMGNDIEKINWKNRAKKLIKLYEEVGG